MFKFLKNRKAHELGKNAGTQITREINDRINGRVNTVLENMVVVFAEIPDKIWDDPNTNPRVAIEAQRIIFEQKLSEFIGELTAEINISLYKWDPLFHEDHEIKELIDTYIKKRMNDKTNETMSIAQTYLEAWLKRPETVAKAEAWKTTANRT